MANNLSRSQNFGGSNQERGPRPYDFVYFPDEPPTENHPPGHDKYLSDHLHGTLFLTLKVYTALHISTGVVVMGSDINRKDIPLIKTMVQGRNKKLLIQGSSLKGCIRSIYEAITNSRMGVQPKNTDQYPYPPERLPSDNINQLCPASIVFGTSGEGWGWQSLVSIQDAYYQATGYEIGFMPNLHSPQLDNEVYYLNDETIGRKFYYNMKHAIDKGEGNGIPAQVALEDEIFITKLIFKNLKPEELGTLLIALGQDKEYPLILKVGAGKPIGMGSMMIKIDKAQVLQNQADLKLRYTSFITPSNLYLTDKSLTNFIEERIKEAHEKLIEKPQLDKLSKILNPVTNHVPYEKY
ncbi:RAMP superfamily CRISPR-associated protein [Nostoc sp.]|uniref:RAMP superfamily CRISPR-associated protein n=1 Tax=Nostoc sp. TaxID=1180 RepID=UPI002FF472C9